VRNDARRGQFVARVGAELAFFQVRPEPRAVGFRDSFNACLRDQFAGRGREFFRLMMQHLSGGLREGLSRPRYKRGLHGGERNAQDAGHLLDLQFFPGSAGRALRDRIAGIFLKRSLNVFFRFLAENLVRAAKDPFRPLVASGCSCLGSVSESRLCGFLERCQFNHEVPRDGEEPSFQIFDLPSYWVSAFENADPCLLEKVSRALCFP